MPSRKRTQLELAQTQHKNLGHQLATLLVKLAGLDLPPDAITAITALYKHPSLRHSVVNLVNCPALLADLPVSHWPKWCKRGVDQHVLLYVRQIKKTWQTLLDGTGDDTPWHLLDRRTVVSLSLRAPGISSRDTAEIVEGIRRGHLFKKFRSANVRKTIVRNVRHLSDLIVDFATLIEDCKLLLPCIDVQRRCLDLGPKQTAEDAWMSSSAPDEHQRAFETSSLAHELVCKLLGHIIRHVELLEPKVVLHRKGKAASPQAWQELEKEAIRLGFTVSHSVKRPAMRTVDEEAVEDDHIAEASREAAATDDLEIVSDEGEISDENFNQRSGRPNTITAMTMQQTNRKVEEEPDPTTGVLDAAFVRRSKIHCFTGIWATPVPRSYTAALPDEILYASHVAHARQRSEVSPESTSSFGGAAVSPGFQRSEHDGQSDRQSDSVLRHAARSPTARRNAVQEKSWQSITYDDDLYDGTPSGLERGATMADGEVHRMVTLFRLKGRKWIREGQHTIQEVQQLALRQHHGWLFLNERLKSFPFHVDQVSDCVFVCSTDESHVFDDDVQQEMTMLRRRYGVEQGRSRGTKRCRSQSS